MHVFEISKIHQISKTQNDFFEKTKSQKVKIRFWGVKIGLRFSRPFWALKTCFLCSFQRRIQKYGKNFEFRIVPSGCCTVDILQSRLQLHYALCEQFFKAQSFVYSPQIQSILICACFWNFENPPNFENPKWFFWKHEKSKSENSILRGENWIEIF